MGGGSNPQLLVQQQRRRRQQSTAARHGHGHGTMMMRLVVVVVMTAVLFSVLTAVTAQQQQRAATSMGLSKPLDPLKSSSSSSSATTNTGRGGASGAAAAMARVKNNKKGGNSGGLQKKSGDAAAAVVEMDDEFMEEDEIIVKDDHIEAIKGLETVDLAFEGIRMTLQKKKKKSSSGNGGGGDTQKVVLDGSICGRARPGRMLAIMGPSGAGKSTVLHALAGRVKDDSKLRLTGKRYVNGEPVAGDSLLPAAFIEQDVNFFPHMTVMETLQFRVALKLGSRLSQHGQQAMVNDLMEQLGLTKVANSIVGNAKVRGISGGERKRLSIAVEMINSPALVFLDEPTSGLDSTAATKLIETLHDLATRYHKTIIAVIHQPNQHVFSKFDDLLLVAEGKQMYFGERKNVRAYFEKHGYVPAREMGTAEHILDCITHMSIESSETEEMAEERVTKLAEAAKMQAKTLDLGLVASGTNDDEDENDNATAKATKRHIHMKHFLASRHGPRANIFIQMKLLLRRSFGEVFRSKTTLLVKTIQQVTMAFVYGGIYTIGTDQASIQDRFGLLSLIAIGAANMALGQAVRSFPREKSIISTEIASKMYRTLPYFAAKAVSELPLVALFNGIFGAIVYRLTGLSRGKGKFRNFLLLLTTHGMLSEAMGLAIGAFAPNQDVALALFPAFIVLNVIFDGKNISVENTPKLLRWIPKIGLIRWAFEGFCVNEFENLTFSSSGIPRGPIAKTGADALSRMGLGQYSVQDVLAAQLAVTGWCWALSYLGLTLTRQRFLYMKTPNGDESAATE